MRETVAIDVVFDGHTYPATLDVMGHYSRAEPDIGEPEGFEVARCDFRAPAPLKSAIWRIYRMEQRADVDVDLLIAGRPVGTTLDCRIDGVRVRVSPEIRGTELHSAVSEALMGIGEEI